MVPRPEQAPVNYTAVFKNLPIEFWALVLVVGIVSTFSLYFISKIRSAYHPKPGGYTFFFFNFHYSVLGNLPG
jgi:hypothetical protein